MIHERVIFHRRNLHKIPELGFQEHKTSAYLWRHLELLKSFELHHVAQTGIIAYRPGNGPLLAFRSDIDALPLTEEVDVGWRSEHLGKMHACGHDGHMGVLLTFAEWLEQQVDTPSIMLIFQPAEEGIGGAKPMLESNLFEQYRPDYVFGLHLAPDLLAGEVASTVGPIFAGAGEFHIRIEGKGGHAAYPHLVNDTVSCAARIITQAQDIPGRFIEALQSCLISFGHLEMQGRNNIIPSQVDMCGTFRLLNESIRPRLKQSLNDLICQQAAFYGCQARIDIETEYPVLVNDAAAVSRWEQAVQQTDVRLIHCQPKMVAEDFAYFAQAFPACFFWLGVGFTDRENYPLHNPHFNIDESGLANGIRIYQNIIRQFQEEA